MNQSTSRHSLTATALPITAFALPPLAVFAPLGAAPLFTAAALLTLIIDWRHQWRHFARLLPLPLLFGGLGLWATVSASWSILPEHSLLEGLRFLALSFGGLVIASTARTIEPTIRERIGRALVAGVMIALVLVAIERFANTPITRLALGLPADSSLPLARFDRGITVLVLSLWPALFVTDDKRLRGLLVAAVVAMATLMVSATALLAAVAGLVVFAAAYVAPRTIAAAMILATLALGVAIPLATPRYETVIALHERAPWIKWSGIHRLVIWRFAADRVAERPILGWGMDASRAIPGGKTDISALAPALHYPGGAEALPLHPHDAALELELELGLPGLVLGLAIIAWVLWWVGWRAALDRERRAGALALAASALTVGLLSFGVWQAWWLSTLWLVSAFYIGVGNDPRRI